MIEIIKYKTVFFLFSSGSCFPASLSVLRLQVTITSTLKNSKKSAPTVWPIKLLILFNKAALVEKICISGKNQLCSELILFELLLRGNDLAKKQLTCRFLVYGYLRSQSLQLVCIYLLNWPYTELIYCDFTKIVMH